MNKKTKTNIVLLIIVVVLIVVPFIFVKGEYGGSDDQGTEQIKKYDPSYKVWAHPVWTPPSSEIESLIFTVQGSLGTGIIAYVIGSAHGRKKALREMDLNNKQRSK